MHVDQVRCDVKVCKEVLDYPRGDARFLAWTALRDWDLCPSHGDQVLQLLQDQFGLEADV